MVQGSLAVGWAFTKPLLLLLCLWLPFADSPRRCLSVRRRVAWQLSREPRRQLP